MGRKFEVALLTGLFIITVGCFSIPVVIYATSSQDAGTNAALLKLTEHFDINKCPQKVRRIAIASTKVTNYRNTVYSIAIYLAIIMITS